MISVYHIWVFSITVLSPETNAHLGTIWDDLKG